MNEKLVSSLLVNPAVKVICLDCVDSTNSYLRRMLDGGEQGVLLAVADTQSAGRGRSGKSFYSEAVGGLYMSLLIHPGISFEDLPSVTAKVCVAVSMVIEKLTSIRTEIKWVNDLYYNGKKVCGILCEAVNDYKKGITNSIIIGVGINVSTAEFPADLQAVAGSLGAVNVTREALAAEITNALLDIQFGPMSDEELSFYRERSYVLGKKINYFVNGQKNTAEAVSIDNSGGLIIKNTNGKFITLTSGEITVRLC